jgi:hypothetical protein
VRGRIKTPAARKPLFARNRAREEVGVEVEVLELVGTYSLADSSLTCHVFRCAIVQGKPEAQPGDEIAEARWCLRTRFPHPERTRCTMLWRTFSRVGPVSRGATCPGSARRFAAAADMRGREADAR